MNSIVAQLAAEEFLLRKPTTFGDKTQKPTHFMIHNSKIITVV